VDKEIHNDISEGFRFYEASRDSFKSEYYNMSTVEKLVMIADEYEKLNLKYLADKKFKDVLLMQNNQPDIWYEFC